jgi:hypothetical protein
MSNPDLHYPKMRLALSSAALVVSITALVALAVLDLPRIILLALALVAALALTDITATLSVAQPRRAGQARY